MISFCCYSVTFKVLRLSFRYSHDELGGGREGKGVGHGGGGAHAEVFMFLARR